MPNSIIGIGIITCATTDKQGVITDVGIQPLFGSKPELWTKADAVKEVQNGAHLYPLWSNGGQQVLGPLVIVVDGKYLRTDPNNTTKDNLGNLPPCGGLSSH